MLAYAITTVPAALAFLTTEHEPETVGTMIDAATVRIEQYCGNGFVRRSYSENHCGGGKRLFLQRSPIVSVASVVDWADTPNSVVAADYDINDTVNSLDHVASWPYPVGSWVVTYTAGRFAATTDVTADLRLAAHFLIADWLGDSQRPVISSTSGTGVRTVNYRTDPGMSERVRNILAPYVRHWP